MKQELNFATHGLNGQINVPGDKSMTHRAIMLGSITPGKTQITHYLAAGDCWETILAFKHMGVNITATTKTLTIDGRSLNQLKNPHVSLNMGNSGTSTRLLMGLLVKQPFEINFVGDASLSQRPLLRVTKPLELMGAKISTQKGHLPAKITPVSQLNGIQYRLPIASAQVKSALIFAALQAKSPSLIEEPIATRDHTERLLSRFGINLKRQGTIIEVIPQNQFQAAKLNLPGDFSAAAFWLVAALITPKSHLILKDVGLNPTRTGLLHLLKRMGAKIIIKNYQNDYEPRGDLEVSSQCLHGIDVNAYDIPAAIDEIPLLVLAATQAKGVTKITGAQELRVKESDRIASVTRELNQLGAKVTELADGFLVSGQTPLHSNDSVTLDSESDHRLAMMLTVAALITKGKVFLKNASVIEISYPNFFRDLKQLIV